MTAMRICAFLILCIFAVVLVSSMVQKASAMSNEDLSEKKGIGGLFKGKLKGGDPRSPKGYQIALGIGAFFVSFAVIKWL